MAHARIGVGCFSSLSRRGPDRIIEVAHSEAWSFLLPRHRPCQPMTALARALMNRGHEVVIYGIVLPRSKLNVQRLQDVLARVLKEPAYRHAAQDLSR